MTNAEWMLYVRNHSLGQLRQLVDESWFNEGDAAIVGMTIALAVDIVLWRHKEEKAKRILSLSRMEPPTEFLHLLARHHSAIHSEQQTPVVLQ